MPSLPTDAVQVEKLVRTALKEKFSGIVGLPNVLSYFAYVNSDSEFVSQFGYKYPPTQKMEYRALFIIFLGFEDDADAGCDNNPVYRLVYTLRLVVSLNDRRGDGTTSTDDFARLVLTLRQRVLNERHLSGYDQLRCEHLTTARSDFGPDERETGLTAHSTDLTLKVEVTPT
jgi:hypothetical protein